MVAENAKSLMKYLRQTNNFAKKTIRVGILDAFQCVMIINLSRIIAIFVLNSWCGIKCQAVVAICQMYDFRNWKWWLIDQDYKIWSEKVLKRQNGAFGIEKIQQ